MQYPAADEPVIVVGGGLAGLSAALEAVHEGASVILIEAEKNVGGNSAKVGRIASYNARILVHTFL